MKLTVVIAAYNEEESIEELTRRLGSALRTIPECSWEILYVVEGRDRTRGILQDLAREIPNIRVLYQEEPSGLGKAFRRGFAAVGPDADYVVTLDADLNHQPEEIPRLVEALRRSGSDIVVGSRFLAASEVEGTPVWKRFLSGTMNLVMRYLYGVRVLDKTSGFRAYKAEVLRALRFENQNFAFLPEILIRAHTAGYRVVEEPIHFIFRLHGKSKMHFWRTSLSYLTLLRSRFDRLSLTVLVLLLLGIGVRAAASFPLHKYPADADALLTGLCARRVLDGEAPVFFAGRRIGSLECHVAAALFTLSGPSRLSLALTAFLIGALTLVAAYGLIRALFGRRLACLALLFLAFPSPAPFFWTYMPNAYPTILLLCAVILAAAAGLARTGGRSWAFGFGLSAGLGLWQSFLTLPCTVAAAAWLAWRRPELLRSVRISSFAAAGFIVGAFPWLAFNTLHTFESFRGNFASRPATGARAVLDNVQHFFAYNLPELFASADPEGGVIPQPSLHRILRLPTLVIHTTAALLFLLLPWLRRRRTVGRGLPEVSAGTWWLFTGVAFLVFLANAASEAGQYRGLTVRYVLPLCLLIPAVVAFLVAAVARWSRTVAAGLAACVVIFNLTGYQWFWQPRRLQLQSLVQADARLVERLEERGINTVLGSYWSVYPVTFLSGERVLGIPCEEGADHYRHAERLVSRDVRWAVIANDQYRQVLGDWAARAGLQGRLETAGPYVLFLPRGAPQAGRKLLERAQAACGSWVPPGL